jgi:hypothetical protein
MVTTKNKAETPEAKARRLTYYRDEAQMRLPEKEADWLARHDAKQKALAEMAAKRLEAKKPPRVPVKDKKLKPLKVEPKRKMELIEAGGRIDAQLAQGESRALLFMRALAMTPLPRRPTKDRLLIKVARLGREEWSRTKFSVDEEGRRLMFGHDMLRLMALFTMMWETGQIRFEFRSIRELWQRMEEAGIGGRGGNSNEELREAFQRLADTATEIRTYRTEAEARADQNHTSQIKVNFIRHSSLPTREECQKEDQGEQTLFPHFIEASRDLADMVSVPKNHIWAHEEVLHEFSGDPLKLRFAMLVLTRAQATQSPAEMSHSELIEAFYEGNKKKYPERKLMEDLRAALEELHVLTGNGLRVKFQEIEPIPTGKRGRPASRWTLQFQPGSKLTTRKAVKSAPKTLK